MSEQQNALVAPAIGKQSTTVAGRIVIIGDMAY